MPGIKRQITEDPLEDEENVHPSRKRRTNADGPGRAELIKIFNDLRDEIPSVRLKATAALVKNLSKTSPEQSQNIDYAITRLIKGVCSGSKAARPGFSIALTEVLRLAFDGKTQHSLSMTALTEKIIALTNPESKAKGEEARNYLLGRQYAFQAVLRSQILHAASDDDNKVIFDAIAELATQKQWLRTECGAGLCSYLESEADNGDAAKSVRILIGSWHDKGLTKSPEGVALWLICKKSFSDVKLPKGCWHHGNPLSSQERSTLTKIMLKNSVDDEVSKGGSGSRQSAPNFAWSVILSYFFDGEGESKSFAHFWTDSIATAMFSTSSSTERKALGLQLFTKAVATAPVPFLKHVVHQNIVRCIVDQRAKADRYLFEAAKIPLAQMTARGKKDAEAATEIVLGLLSGLPSSVDKLTKNTLEALLASAAPADLGRVVQCLQDLSWSPGTADPAEADKRRRSLADLFLALVRSRGGDASYFLKDPQGKPRAKNIADWLRHLLTSLTELGYSSGMQQASPEISSSIRDVFRERLMSVLNVMLTLPLEQSIWLPRIVVEKLSESVEDSPAGLNKQAIKTLKEAKKTQKQALEKASEATASSASTAYAFHLLLSLGMLQVYRQEPDGVSVLDDIIGCFRTSGDDDLSSVMLVELLLSFITKPSALFRKVSEQVFIAFAPQVTEDALDSMLDILKQKESIAGQQELFDNNDDLDGDVLEADDSDVEIESASDIEIVNGAIVDVEDDSDDGSDSDEIDSEGGSGDEDEEAAFDRKLADALGSAGMEQGEDSDGSDMDDDQMMALDTHLTTIFKERKKDSNKKQENKDAKENMVNFKNRVLDLLDAYVKTQYANPIALNLIIPLVELSRTTTNPPTAKKALGVVENYFDACKKNRALPEASSDQAGLESIEAILAEARLGGSKLHATACSRSLQFLAKILILQDSDYWPKIARMMVELQHEWRQDAKSKIHRQIFNDWHNWSMQR